LGPPGYEINLLYIEEAELTFDFEAEDNNAAGEKVLEIAKRLKRMSRRSRLENPLDRSNQNRRASMPSHRFAVMVARGCLWLTLVPAEAAPSPLGGDSEMKITHVTSAWQWRTGANALRLVPVALLEKSLIEPA
jgi:hypothetical protein